MTAQFIVDLRDERALEIALVGTFDDAMDHAGLDTRTIGSTFAIPSSALDEDSAGHSFAGMTVTLTNVTTPEEVEHAITRCWASVFGQRALTCRALQGISSSVPIVVVVQMMIDSIFVDPSAVSDVQKNLVLAEAGLDNQEQR